AGQPDPLGTRGRVGHRLDRPEVRHGTEDLLLRPCTVEAELLGPLQIVTCGGGVERAVGDELGDADRIGHAATLVPSLRGAATVGRWLPPAAPPPRTWMSSPPSR